MAKSRPRVNALQALFHVTSDGSKTSLEKALPTEQRRHMICSLYWAHGV